MNYDFEGKETSFKKKSRIKIGFIILFFLLAVLISMIINRFVLEIALVEGASMEPCLFSGERLIVFKLAYAFTEPKAQDIIVLHFLPSDGVEKTENTMNLEYIKRIIGTPGDLIDLKYQQVYLNKDLLNESYAQGVTRQKKLLYPMEIHNNHCFVMGDNREYSRDSRDIGLVSTKYIIGKAVFRIWPLTKIGVIK
ncbi:MAG: signal peptidase I [Spirochaetales bacterium]|nr:signal peptidase I [Spirochaetales bacterium]